MDLKVTLSYSIPAAPNPTPSISYAAKAAIQPSFRPTPAPAPKPITPPPGPRGRTNEDLKRHTPILVEALPNWTSHMAAITERLGRAPSVRLYGSGFRFLPSSVEEWRVVQAYLSGASAADSAIKWYCYALTEGIPTKVVIRGLPADKDAAVITQAVKELGFPARYARCIEARRGRPGCIFYVALDHLSKVDLARLYAVNELLYLLVVSVEDWRSGRGPAQCHRCQAFGHASTNCHRAVGCVRCAGEHVVADCPRPREGPFTCANCGKDHAAVDRRCAIYRRKVRSMGLTVPPPMPPVPRPRNTPAPIPIPTVSLPTTSKGKGTGCAPPLRGGGAIDGPVRCTCIG